MSTLLNSLLDIDSGFLVDRQRSRGRQWSEAKNAEDPEFTPRPDVATVDVARVPVLLSDLVIRTKDKRVVPFVPNTIQQRYLDILAPEWRVGVINLRGWREIILKARQEGLSTLTAALFFLDTVNNPNTETVVIAHDKEATEKLFRMVQLFHAHLPKHKRPATKAESKRELVYSGLNSTYRVLTAGTKTSGRSSTINNLHCTEVAFWEDPDVLTGLLQAVPADGNIFQESTANGEGVLAYDGEGNEVVTGSQFHVDYVKAQAGKSGYTARFFGWQEHGEYQTVPPADFERIGEGSDPADVQRYGNEVELAEQYGLTDDQLYWRRNKVNEPGMGGMFRQEYPANPVEAFRAGGLRFFDTWSDALHTCEPFPIPHWWTRIGAYDWGTDAPRCFLLAAVDERLNVYITHELYERGLTNPKQAKSVKELLASEGVDSDIIIWADSSMWNLKTESSGRQVADVQAFHDEGLMFVAAGKNDRFAWSNVRTFLSGTIDNPPEVRTKSVIVFKPGDTGREGCPNLIRTMPLMKRDPMKPEKMLEVFQRKPVEDHAPATLGYLLGWHLQPSKGEPPPPKPQTGVTKHLIGFKKPSRRQYA